jgi:hypothetical protein
MMIKSIISLELKRQGESEGRTDEV